MPTSTTDPSKKTHKITAANHRIQGLANIQYNWMISKLSRPVPLQNAKPR